MKYQLLNDNTGVIITRKPFLTSSAEEITITFENAPNFATVIFTDEKGKTFYRSLKNCSCQITTDLFSEGAITVLITVPNGQVSPPKWICEGLLCQKKGKTVVISPNEAELSSIVANLKIEVSNLKALVEKQQNNLTQLDGKVSAIADGYDEL